MWNELQMAPERTVAIQRLEGMKKTKDRFFVLVCSNADGSENFEPIFIGNLERQRPLWKKYGSDFGLDYPFNEKS